VIRQADVPGRLFSATGNGCADAATAEGAGLTGLTGLRAEDPELPLHAADSSTTARVTATPAARRLRFTVTPSTEPHHGTTGQQTRLDVPLSPSLITWDADPGVLVDAIGIKTQFGRGKPFAGHHGDSVSANEPTAYPAEVR
jgi:hypothetical protein